MVLLVGVPQAFCETCTKEDAKKAVLYVVDLVKTKGKAAIPEIEKFRFCGGEGYVYISDMNVVILVHPVHKQLVGVNQANTLDARGKYFAAELKVKANGPGEGWVSYAWPNPKTNVIEDKCTYLKTSTMDGKRVIVCAGIGGVSPKDCK
jgi:signal transduction histidine kinase